MTTSISIRKVGPIGRSPLRLQLVRRNGGVARCLSQTILLLLVCCDSRAGPERWEPRVLDITFDHNGNASTIALDKTPPTISFDEGDRFTVLSFGLKMFPVQHTKSGATWVRVRDLPPMRQADLAILVRVSATPRSVDRSGHCWDVRDRVSTDRKPAEAGAWRVSPSPHVWNIGARWDEVRVDVLFRRITAPSAGAPNSGGASTEEYTINSLMLEPTSPGQAIRTRVGQNVYSRVFDWIRGIGNCSS